jgi:hypothetical protein
MRKFAAAALALFATVGLTLAAEVTFVKYDDAKKELVVSEGGKDVTYKVTDATVFKAGDKDVPADKAIGRMDKLKSGKSKFEITADKDTLKEVKFAGKKAK